MFKIKNLEYRQHIGKIIKIPKILKAEGIGVYPQPLFLCSDMLLQIFRAAKSAENILKLFKKLLY